MTDHAITDAEYARALEAGRHAAETEFRASAIRYNAGLDALEVITARNGGFVIPRQIVGVLQDVTPQDLARLELWPDGSVVEIDDLDIHISVDGMVRAALPLLVPRRIMSGMPSAKVGTTPHAAKAERSRRSGQKAGQSKVAVNT